MLNTAQTKQLFLTASTMYFYILLSGLAGDISPVLFVNMNLDQSGSVSQLDEAAEVI